MHSQLVHGGGLTFMDWHTLVKNIRPYVVKIETPDGHGSGFLCLYNRDKSVCGIATAHHVVSAAEYWEQPIRIIHADSEPRLLKEEDRVIFTSPGNDSAVILFPKRDLKLPEDLIELIPAEKVVNIGVECIWLGYPSVAPRTLCFFRGTVSARLGTDAYYIDGVAINGVSGGPVLYVSKPGDKLRIMGSITAYSPNRLATGTLPGLSIAQDVTYFHDAISQVRSFEEARDKREQQKKDAPPDLQPPPPQSDNNGQG